MMRHNRAFEEERLSIQVIEDTSNPFVPKQRVLRRPNVSVDPDDERFICSYGTCQRKILGEESEHCPLHWTTDEYMDNVELICAEPNCRNLRRGCRSKYCERHWGVLMR
ncbi:hypothetical protein Gasu2_33990 [Galdieria sulphuraria]|nr:hypothetical protein Gasu2_33990 [Galdieria sulphuraria]